MGITSSRKITKIFIVYILMVLAALHIILKSFQSNELSVNEDLRKELQGLKSKLKFSENAFKNIESELDRLKLKTESEKWNIEHGQHEKAYKPEYEQLRRKLGDFIDDLNFYLKAELSKINQDGKTYINLVENFNDRMNNIISVYRQIPEHDGYQRYREAIANEIRDSIANKFFSSHQKCDSKRIECDISKSCGFGCQLHHLAYCSVVAYHLNRSLVVHSQSWSYGNGAFESLFKKLPALPTNCPKQMSHNNLDKYNAEVIHLPIIEQFRLASNLLPMSIPSHLAKYSHIRALHGNMFVLFVGNLIKHLLTLQPNVQDRFNEIKRRIDFSEPIVGIHVRRTDKIITEASFHALDEYMKHVSEYFDIEELKLGRPLKRRVYVATDDSSLLKNTKQIYPNYQFFFDMNSSLSGQPRTRYSKESVTLLTFDMLLLSECDFLVCTFSSQVCRIAYEILQTRYPDGSWRFRSLDDIYYFGAQQAHDYEATMNHTASNPNEISFIKGDIIGIAGNHWNGYCKGTNRRTGMLGLFPSYKAKDVIRVFDEEEILK